MTATCHVVTGGEQAIGYAEYLLSSRAEEAGYSARRDRGDYYLGTEGSKPAAMGIWWGRGAEELGLAGRAVERAALLRTWGGRDPATNELLVRVGANGAHDASIDVTFSAPKSVSMLWAKALSSDPELAVRIEDAVTRSTEAALAHLQRECELVRRRIEGEVRHEAAGGLVVARFRHHTSRLTREQEAAGHIPDMQLHDHCVIANLALRQEGREDATGNRWGCIDARAVMLMQLEAGALWRVQLAHEMERLGFAIQRVGDAWELRGVTRAQIERNSGRDREVRERIAQWTREHGRPPREDERRTIVVTGRRGKGSILPSDNAAHWAQRVEDVEVERHAGLRSITIEDTAAAIVRELVDGHDPITRESAVFDERTLCRRVALEMQGSGEGRRHQASDFRAILERVERSPELVRLDDRHWTTRTHLDTERLVVDTLKVRASERTQGIRPAVVEAAIAEHEASRCRQTGTAWTMDTEQRAAVFALCSREGAGLLVAAAGTGKGEAARAAAIAHRRAGYRVVAVATAGDTAQRLGLEVGADIAKSIDGLCAAVKHAGLKLGRRDFVLVDEVGQMETARWRDLLEALQGAKLRGIGDPRQLSSVEAGGLLPVLAQQIGAAHLSTVYRAREQWTRDAWAAIREGRGLVALQEYEARGLVFLYEDRKALREGMFREWNAARARGAAEGRPVSDYLMTTDTSNVETDILNAMAQRARIEAGEVSVERTLTGREHAFPTRYEDPERPEYIREETLHPGDLVKACRPIRVAGGRRIENGMRGQVISASSLSLTVAFTDGREITFGEAERDAFRLGYAQHVQGVQGRTVEEVDGLAGGRSTTQESGYVEVSRARGAGRIHADMDTLGIPTERRLPDGTREPIPAAERREMALARLAERYSTSAEKVSALSVLAQAEETPEAEPTPVPLSLVIPPASVRQRDYVESLGGRLPEDASWLEASLILDRLQGRPEGEQARRWLLDRASADVVDLVVDQARARVQAWEQQVSREQATEKAAPAREHASDRGEGAATAPERAAAAMQQEVGVGMSTVANAGHGHAGHVPAAGEEQLLPQRPVEHDAQRWDQARSYLIRERGLPADWVDALHRNGRLGADTGGNAVFHRDDVGRFSVTVSGTSRHERPTLIIASSEIEALSVLQVYRQATHGRQTGPVTVIAMDGQGTVPHEAIREMLDRGGVVRVAMNNDHAGENVWQAIRMQHPSPQVVRDRPVLQHWNDVLRDPARAHQAVLEAQHGRVQQGAAQSRVQVATRTPASTRRQEREPTPGGA